MGALRRGLIRESSSARQVPGDEKWDRNGRPSLPLNSCKSNGFGTMTRYFFHVRDEDGDVSQDFEGQELTDLPAARAEAIRTNREMLGERLLHGGDLDHRRIEISDASGRILDKVDANDVLFAEGQLRSFSDDVTKSAPIGPSFSTAKNSAPE